MFKHALSVLSTSQGISLYGLDRSTHGTNSFQNVSVDELIDLCNVRGKLLDVVLFLGELEQ